ncbi:MAG: hypothetical protein KDI36_17535 [Pseudomonadales bacterium]|nr:hypothetical protein [Pseudomonadales bacterium]
MEMLIQMLYAMYLATAQYAQHSHEESVNLKRLTSLKEALDLFDDFDWEGQAVEAQKLQKVSPTLSIQAENGDDLVWVSVGMNPGGSLFFVTECTVQKGMKSILFGLIKRPNYVGSYNDGASKEMARKVIEEFFDLRDSKGGV